MIIIVVNAFITPNVFSKSLFGYIRAKCKSCWRKIKGEKVLLYINIYNKNDNYYI